MSNFLNKNNKIIKNTNFINMILILKVLQVVNSYNLHDLLKNSAPNISILNNKFLPYNHNNSNHNVYNNSNHNVYNNSNCLLNISTINELNNIIEIYNKKFDYSVINNDELLKFNYSIECIENMMKLAKDVFNFYDDINNKRWSKLQDDLVQMYTSLEKVYDKCFNDMVYD